MIRLNISFTEKQAKQLDRERERTGIPTSTLLRRLIDEYLTKRKKGEERCSKVP